MKKGGVFSGLIRTVAMVQEDGGGGGGLHRGGVGRDPECPRF